MTGLYFMQANVRIIYEQSIATETIGIIAFINFEIMTDVDYTTRLYKQVEAHIAKSEILNKIHSPTTESAKVIYKVLSILSMKALTRHH